ncbi:hypothetical protein QFZ82_000109 [Streptomyces sp. V4I23]|nr:hypothetical protein [Streptomyces sp. V4I23]
MEQLALEALEERFGEGIVIARADAAHAAADAVPAGDLGEGGRAVLGAPVAVETTLWTRSPRAAAAISIASVTREVCLWSAIDQPTAFLEQMSITVAR